MSGSFLDINAWLLQVILYVNNQATTNRIYTRYNTKKNDKNKHTPIHIHIHTTTGFQAFLGIGLKGGSLSCSEKKGDFLNRYSFFSVRVMKLQFFLNNSRRNGLSFTVLPNLCMYIFPLLPERAKMVRKINKANGRSFFSELGCRIDKRLNASCQELLRSGTEPTKMEYF